MKRSGPLERRKRPRTGSAGKTARRSTAAPKRAGRKPLRRASAKLRALRPLDDAARLRILERDGFQCRVCRRFPSYGRWLEVHHIHTRRILSKRHEDNNLVTLCKTLDRDNCHDWAHRNGKTFRAWFDQ